jgi:hypothetical protein
MFGVLHVWTNISNIVHCYSEYIFEDVALRHVTFLCDQVSDF